MEDIFVAFPDKEAFDRYWSETYEPLTYEDVRDAYENYVEEVQKHIFISDYEAAGAISMDDFMENLSEQAQFAFQDALTEIFYDKNPDLYETAFAIFEEAQLQQNGKGTIAATFHQEYDRLYHEFVKRMFDTYFAKKE